MSTEMLNPPRVFITRTCANPSILVGMHSCLRGGQEHCDLKVDQFQRFPGDCQTYDASLSMVQKITRDALLRSK